MFFYNFLPVFYLWVAYSISWVVGIVIDNSSVVDSLWGVAIAFLCLYQALVGEAPRNVRLFIATAFVIIWGLRLSLHIFYRNHILLKKEDIRYTKLKDNHLGNWSLYSYLNPNMFALLGTLAVSLPVSALSSGTSVYAWLSFGQSAQDIPKFLGSLFDWVGIVFYCAGMYLEVVSDWELLLYRMKTKRHGGLYTSGLWSLCRHPNYLGECLIWWGIYFFACAQGSYWTIISPIFISCIIYLYSGVEWKERHMFNTREKNYTLYQGRTPKFIPLPWKF